MPLPPVRALLPVLAVVLALAGCASPRARIEKNPEVFAALPADVQAAVREGRIDIGFSKDAVYLALGRPDRQYRRTTAQGTVSVWSFVASEYYTDSQLMDGHYYVRDRRGRLRPVYDSQWVDVRHSREYETLRIEFQDDVVTAVEQISHP